MQRERTSWKPLSASAGRTARRVALGAWALILLAKPITAQMLGAPVLQNSWATPGIVGAFDFSGGDGELYAAAAAWTPAAGRFQLSGGAGIRSGSDSRSKYVYGVRAAMLFGGLESSIGLGAFAGVGGGGGGTATGVDTLASTTAIPIGISAGWRHSLGATRGISVYASPSYVFYTGGDDNDGLVRAGLGVDMGLTRSIGVSAGIEFGQTRSHGAGGPSGTLYAFGLSYVLGHR
jgi:hypothetical protein